MNNNLKLLKEYKEGHDIRKALTEDIYMGKANTTALVKMDKLFDELLSLVKGRIGIDKKDRNKADAILTKLIALANAMFKIDVNLYIDYNRRKMTNIAYTYFSEDAIAVAESELKEIVVKQDYGYHMINSPRINVAYENAALWYLKNSHDASQYKDAKSKQIAERLTPFTGRHMTEIYLHELSHNILISFYFNQRNDGALEIKFDSNKSKPIVVYPDKLFSGDIVDGTLNFILMTITLSSMISCPPLIFFRLPYLLAQISKYSDNGTYMRNEKNANTIPFQYGYGKEILENSVRIKLIFDRYYPPGFIDRIVNVFVRLTKWSGNEYQTIITRDLLRMIDFEKKNPNLSPEELEYVKSVEKHYKKYIKELQILQDVYGEQK